MAKAILNKVDIIGKFYIASLLVIFGGIVLHAPLSVWLGSIWPNYDLLIKSWKEILIIVDCFLGLYLIFYQKQKKLLHDPLLLAIMAYGALHLVLLVCKFTGFVAVLAGLAIDLRYVAYFGLVYVALRLFPEYRQLFIKVGIAGALVVVMFAMLQVFVLPRDVLKYIGYSKDTISPYLTIDKNDNFVRINSTLRGPNPLGAYAVLVLACLGAYLAKYRSKYSRKTVVVTMLLLIGSLVALWASYSRSALIGLFVSLILGAAIGLRGHLSKRVLAAIGIVLVVTFGGLFAARDSTFVSNVVLHTNPSSSVTEKSNTGHIESLGNGLGQLVKNPLGDGVGSTGSASLYTKNPEIIENQYLFVGHEVGWLGLAYFLSIFAIVMYRLWKKKSDWLSLGVLASGFGLAIIGLLLPVWADDTVSIVWWGLAAVALSSHIVTKKRKIVGVEV